MSQENVEILRRSYDVWSGGLTEENPRPALRAQLDEFHHPEVIFTTHVGPIQETYQGHDAVMTFYEHLLEAWESMKLIPVRVVEAGDDVVVLFLEITMRSRTGHTLVGEMAHVASMRDGKVEGLDMYRDGATALDAVGLSD